MTSPNADELVFAAEDDSIRPDSATPWMVLVVDDDDEVHRVTRLALSEFRFMDRPVEVKGAKTIEEARAMIGQTPDLAVVLLDMVMEQEKSGLDIVHFLREDRGNRAVQIILRTGYPGQAPEQDLVLRLDINDYRAKSELTHARLNTVMAASLRAYHNLNELFESRAALEQLNQTLEAKVAERTRALTESRDRLQQILDALITPTLIARNADSAPVYMNPAAVMTFGPLHRQHTERGVADLFATPRDWPHLLDRIKEAGRIEDAETEMKHAGGAAFWAALTATRLSLDDEDCVLMSVSDISERKVLEMELRRMATTDALTGAFNRRYLIERGDDEIGRAGRYNRPLSMLMLDIDHFKKLNDTYGHTTGDRMLQALVDRCMEVLRSVDIFGRVGGEEFAAILPETDREGAQLAAERLRTAVENLTVETRHGALQMTISLGTALWTADDHSIADTLNRADQALYTAKRQGRNRVVIGD